ncbi:MAG: SDR family oxidoreductase [Desulfobacteraceae bacterium]|nr:SDR family oxidoreductase [Desulfobacteraceae bacterium]
METKAETAIPYDLKDRFGIVTGAASGIGQAAAVHLARMGAAVALVDLNQAGLEETVALMGRQSDAPTLVFTADATDDGEVQRVVSETADAFGSLDFLINSAGILRRSGFLEMPLEEWDLMIRVNLRGPFLYCRHSVPHMVRQGRGVVVNVASLAGRSSSILGGAHYTSAKHALIGLSRHMARELGPRGVRVNAFCPGATLTPMTVNSTTEEEIEAVAATIPRQRWATPGEQAAVIGFLVSDASINITGACIDSNGGSLMI